MTQYFDSLAIRNLARQGIISQEMARKAMPDADLPGDTPPDPAAVRSIALVVILCLFALFFWLLAPSAKTPPVSAQYSDEGICRSCGRPLIPSFFFIAAGSSNDRA